MPGMFHDYPYVDMHEMNLDYILRMARQTMGLHLQVVGDKLQLKNAANEVISDVTVSYATRALNDTAGHEITAYILSAGVQGDYVIFTDGAGNQTTITVPFANKAKYDVNGNELDNYIYNVSISGDKLRYTKGDGTVVEVTCPFATKAASDVNSKDLTTYAASLSAEVDKIVLRDSMGRLLDQIEAPYALKALADADNDDIRETYGATLATGSTTVILKSKNGDTLSTITVPFATHAGNAYESIAIVGDQMVFTKGDGTQTTITVPFSVKAERDSLGNVIKNTYVANVVNDPGTGTLTFYNAQGVAIATLTPTVTSAVEDSLGNTISDYIISLVNSVGSDYLTVTHGDGQVDSITVNYSNHAWKDTNENVIKNFYVHRLEIVESPAASGVFYLVAYNGDNPEAELYRIKLISVSYDAVNMDISITIGGI